MMSTDDAFLKDLIAHIYLNYCDHDVATEFAKYWIAHKWDNKSSICNSDLIREVYYDWNEWIGWVL